MELRLKYIGKKEPFDDDKKQEDLDKDDYPEFFADLHVSKAIYIEMDNLFCPLHAFAPSIIHWVSNKGCKEYSTIGSLYVVT
jgi:hypothetical protein